MKENRETTQEVTSLSLKDYIMLFRDNLFAILMISVTCIVFAVVYALNAVNIYNSTTAIKISKPTGSILDASALAPQFGDFGMDRFIANEIEILQSYNLRERVAKSLIDTFNTTDSAGSFSVIIDKSPEFKNLPLKVKSVKKLADDVKSIISIQQKRGLDIVEITASSPSPFEAKLIADVYSQEYRNLNLEFNRSSLSFLKSFMLTQRNEKLNDLNAAEELLTKYQEKGGIIALEEQAKTIIGQLSDVESQKNMGSIEVSASEQILSKYQAELRKQEPNLSAYLDNFASEQYLKGLQQEIATLEVNRDMAVSAKNLPSYSPDVVKSYDLKIKELKAKLDAKISTFKAGIFASSPEQIKELGHKIIEEEVKLQAAKIKVAYLDNVLTKYEAKFSTLPKSSIEFARLQRNREALEKLYSLVEQRFQEALINEQSAPGNVTIIDMARRADKPAKPNRSLIIFIGFVLGMAIAVGFVLVRNYFDNTVKTPEDLTRRGLNVLSWIPQIEGITGVSGKDLEFIVAAKPDSIPSEAFRALRTRVQFSKVDSNELKVILVTSSAPAEGKTLICTNLAGSFAQTDKKTLIVDFDLRKPRIHSFFRANRYPGVVDYLFGKVSFEEIIRETEIPNLYYITAGTIPPNPAELLESNKMGQFIESLKEEYDYILLDTPPIIAVTDSEIAAKYADASILVVSANTTEKELMERAVEIMRSGETHFIGVVLNNFIYRSSYGSYYKYYYYYSRTKHDKDKAAGGETGDL